MRHAAVSSSDPSLGAVLANQAVAEKAVAAGAGNGVTTARRSQASATLGRAGIRLHDGRSGRDSNGARTLILASSLLLRTSKDQPSPPARQSRHRAPQRRDLRRLRDRLRSFYASSRRTSPSTLRRTEQRRHGLAMPACLFSCLHSSKVIDLCDVFSTLSSQCDARLPKQSALSDNTHHLARLKIFHRLISC